MQRHDKTPLCTGHEPLLGMSRRRFLDSFGMGLGGLALADLLPGRQASAADAPETKAVAETAPAPSILRSFEASAPRPGGAAPAKPAHFHARKTHKRYK